MACTGRRVLVRVPPAWFDAPGIHVLEEAGYEAPTRHEEQLKPAPKIGPEFIKLASSRLPLPGETSAAPVVAVMRYMEHYLSDSALADVVYSSAPDALHWTPSYQLLDCADQEIRRVATAIMVISSLSSYAEEVYAVLRPFLGATDID